MNPRNTVVVLLLLAALGAYVYWVELPAESRKAEEEKLLAVDEAQVTGVTLAYPDRTIALAKDAAGWQVTVPIAAPADDTAVKNLLTAIATAKTTRTLEDVADKLASYGLETPVATVTLQLADGTSLPVLKVGEATSVGFSCYVQRGDDPNVYITAGVFQSGMVKKLGDLRDKRILTFEDQDVTWMTLTAGADTLVLERADANADWAITAPAAYPADGSEVRALLASARGLRANDFVTDAPDVDVARYRLDTPQLTLALRTGTDDGEQRLLIGGANENDATKELYARRADRATVYTIPEYALKNLGKDLATLRDKTVLRYDAAAAATIVVARKDGAGFTLTKGPDGWHSDDDGPGAERAPTISRFVDDLHGFKGSEIVGEGGVDLAAFGLDAPDLTITVRSADGTALGTLVAVRDAAGGDEAVAHVAPADGGIVYAVKPYALDRVDKPASAFRDPPDVPIVAASPAP